MGIPDASIVVDGEDTAGDCGGRWNRARESLLGGGKDSWIQKWVGGSLGAPPSLPHAPQPIHLGHHRGLMMSVLYNCISIPALQTPKQDRLRKV